MGRGVGRDAGEAEAEGRGREGERGRGGCEGEHVVGAELLLPARTGSRQGQRPPQRAANSARAAFCPRWPRICRGSVSPSGGQSLPPCGETVGRRRRLAGGRAAPCALLPQRRLTSMSRPLSPNLRGRGSGPELRGFLPPHGNPVLLSSEGWNGSHDFGHLTDLGL